MHYSLAVRRLTLAFCLGLLPSCSSTDVSAPLSQSRVAQSQGALTLERAALAQWGPVISLPIVPVAAANLPDGRVLFWSAEDRFAFGVDLGRTYTALFNPATGTATERLVSETGHDMFCPGTANLPDGRVLVNGGISSARTSIYDPVAASWTRVEDMNIARGYQASTLLHDGSVLTLGGSWSGGVGNKHAEVWTEQSGWRLLSGVRIDPFLSTDSTRDFGIDSHFWLFATGSGRVFHAGPGVNMHWIDTAGNGEVTPVGPRGDDEFSVNGNAVLFDRGRILKVGGAPGYEGLNANANSYVIELGADVSVRKLQPMAYRRGFHNSVVLPNGQVVIIGGATVAVGFSDNNSVLAPEIFDPVTETFSTLPAMSVPRNYHSVALLLPDGRVLSGGGGLCGNGCAANHPDLQILSPPYLFNDDGSLATRPLIESAPLSAAHGTTLQVTTDRPVSAFAIVRSSSTTHTVANDQRRLPLSFEATGPSSYAVAVPTNPGWALPGLYMLFALDALGVPSLAHMLRIGSASPLTLVNPSDQSTEVGVDTSLAFAASSPSGAALSFGASGLPAGLSIDTTSGVIAGFATTVGRWLVEVSVSDGEQTVSTELSWDVFGASTQNQPPSLALPTPPAVMVGEPTTLLLEASDPDADALTYAATGLPPGLGLDVTTGAITGVSSAPGNYSVNASVSDRRGGNDSVQFVWHVGAPPPSLEPVVAPIATDGEGVTYAAQGSDGLEYSWSFGDGTQTDFSSSSTVTHTFPGPGVYFGTLTARNADGVATSVEFVQAVSSGASAGSPQSSSNLVEELRSDGAPRLWVTNIDNDSVSVFASDTFERLAEIPVGTAPRSIAVTADGRIWVSNKASSSLSVIDPNSLAVTETVNLGRATEPFGMVADSDGSLYVALEALGRVRKLSAAGTTLVEGDVGSHPRHLALSAAGDRLLVSRFITPPLPGEATALVQTSVGGVEHGGEVLILDPATLTTTRTVVLRHSDDFDTTISGRGIPNYLGAAAISPDDSSAWIPSKQDNVMRGVFRDQLSLDFQNTVRAVSSRIDLETETEDHVARVDHDNAGVASAAAYHPSGVYLFVALESSRQIAVMDAHGKRELLRAEAGLAPQAVVISADGLSLYVHNALDRSLMAYDLAPLVRQGVLALPLSAVLDSVVNEKLDAQVLRGKQLFYDARDSRLARDGYLSCAACHNDGGQDGRVWDLTGFGEGLRNTIDLRGRAGAQGGLHWTANFDEVQDFEGQIRMLAQGTGLMTDAAYNAGTRNQPLGDPKAGQSADLDALAAYVASLSSFAPSPHRTPAGALTPAGMLGRDVFAAQCAECHAGPDFTDSDSGALHDVGTLKPSSGGRLGEPLTGLDAPTLRGSSGNAPYLHDGSAQTLEEAILAHTNVTLTEVDRANVAAFASQLGGEEPAVLPLSPTEPPVNQPPVNQPPINQPPVNQPPVNQPPVRLTGLQFTALPNTSRGLAATLPSYSARTNTGNGPSLEAGSFQVISPRTTPPPGLDTPAPIPLSMRPSYRLGRQNDVAVSHTLLQLVLQMFRTTPFVVIPTNHSRLTTTATVKRRE